MFCKFKHIIVVCIKPSICALTVRLWVSILIVCFNRCLHCDFERDRHCTHYVIVQTIDCSTNGYCYILTCLSLLLFAFVFILFLITLSCDSFWPRVWQLSMATPIRFREIKLYDAFEDLQSYEKCFRFYLKDNTVTNMKTKRTVLFWTIASETYNFLKNLNASTYLLQCSNIDVLLQALPGYYYNNLSL